MSLNLKIFGSILFFLITVIILIHLSYHPDYYHSLVGDVSVFYQRALFFLNHFSLRDLSYNEYQPGALAIFFLLSPVLLINNSLETFQITLLIFNSLLILSTGFIIYKYFSYQYLLIFSLLLIALGPIIFFRFDLVVGFLVIISLLTWQINKKTYSYILLGLATTIKIYPIIFLPLLLFYDYQKTNLKTKIIYSLTYLSTICTVVLFFIFIFQTTSQDLLAGYNFHNYKPLGSESFLASIIVLKNIIFNQPLPQTISEWGINGLAYSESIFSINFYNYLWLLPVSILYFLYFNFSKDKTISIIFCQLLILTLLMFYKVSTPQYFIWLAILIPLVDKKILLTKTYLLILLLLSISFGIYQYIYPLHYLEYIDNFFKQNQSYHLFYINLTRNLLLLIVFLLYLYLVFRRRTHTQ